MELNGLKRVLKHPSFKRLSGETFWVAMGYAGSILAMLFGVRLLTTLLSPQEYGRLALAVSLALAIKHSLGMGMAMATTRFFSVAEEEDSFPAYWKCLHRVWRWTGVLFLLASFLVAGMLKMLAVPFAVFWGCAIIFGGITALFMMISATQNAARNRKRYALHRVLFDFLRFGFAWVVIYLFSPTSLNGLLGFIFAGGLVTASCWFFAARLRKKTLNAGVCTAPAVSFSSGFYRYLWPIVIGGLFMWIQLMSDRWVLSLVASVAEVGVYCALYQLSFSPALQLMLFMMDVLSPVLFKESGNLSDSRRHRNAIRINGKLVGGMLFGLALVMGLVWKFNPLIMKVFLGSAFRENGFLFPWMILAGGLYAIGQQLLLTVYMGLDSVKPLVFRGVVALLSVGFVSVGGVFGGMPGVTFGLLASSAVFFIGSAALHLVESGCSPDGEGGSYAL